MVEKTPLYNNQLVNANDFSEKFTFKRKKSIIRFEDDTTTGTGFLCKINYKNDYFYAIITCYHVIGDKYKEQFQQLYFSYFKGEEEQHVIINLKDGRLFYQNKDYDITIIEMNKNDPVDLFSSLEIDYSIDTNNIKLDNKKVYLLQYPKGQSPIFYSQGIIKKEKEKSQIFSSREKIKKELNRNYFIAYYASEVGSSGCPIIDYEKDLAIGIHRGKCKKHKKIKGICILKLAIDKFIREKGGEIENAINSNPFPYSNTMDMIYRNPNNNKENQFFNEDFINKYKDEKEIKIIHNGEQYKLDTRFSSLNLTKEEQTKEEIKITLMGIEYMTDMSYMFAKCKDLKKVIATKTYMRNVENMRSMFEGCSNLEELSDTSHWNLENVKTLRGLFYLCKNLKKIPGIDKWNPTNLQGGDSCNEMFYGCSQSLDKEQISQVMKWENVDKKIKNKHKKGFNNKDLLDFIAYCFTENIDETASNFFDFVKIFC